MFFLKGTSPRSWDFSVTRTVSTTANRPSLQQQQQLPYITVIPLKKQSVLIMITPKRRLPSACRTSCKFQPFLTPFINTTCSDIDCCVLSVLTSQFAGHAVWNQLSVLLLGGLHRLRTRLLALTGGAGVDFDNVLIRLSLWMRERHELCKINSLTPCEPDR